MWFSRDGKAVGAVAEAGDIHWPSLSDDGTAVAYSRRNAETGYYEAWVHDLKRDHATRLTAGLSANANYPVWSPDGRVVFAAGGAGNSKLYIQDVRSGAQPEVLLDKDGGLPMDWSSDGRFVIFQTSPARDTSFDLWLLRLAEGRTPTPLLATRAAERRPRIAPNGRLVAYMSDETGRSEIYVQTFPPPGRKWPVTSSGGSIPVWSRDGSELYYISPDRQLMAVAVAGGDVFEAGAARPLFTLPGAEDWYDVGPDGRFLIAVPSTGPARDVPISLMLNWTSVLTK